MRRLRRIAATMVSASLCWLAMGEAPGSLESEPLEIDEGVGTGGGVLFDELDAQRAGLSAFVNDYSSPDVWGKRWREYILGTIGTGIALGDIDGDGLPDLFVVSKDEESRLYRNIGDFRFVDIGEEAGFRDSPYPGTGCSFADVDGDGDLDLYLCYVRGGNELWINDGAGRFQERAEAWGVDVKSGSTMASFADYDLDGDLDLYLQNNLVNEGVQFETLSDQLFENRGTHFVEVTEAAGVAGPAHGHSALWWDYDEDGDADIYVANDFEEPDKLYRNNGDGTFTDVIASVTSRIPYYSMGADFGDIDNDGHSDFWVADMAPTTRAQYLRTIGTHHHVYTIRGDERLRQHPRNVLLYKQSPHRFVDVAHLAGLAETDWTWAARLVDLNNDGRLDSYATNGMLRSFHDGDLGRKKSQLGNRHWILRAFRDEPTLEERNLAFENMGGLRFERRGDAWGLEKLGVSFGVAFGDLDGDGDLDLVLNNYKESVSVYRNNDVQGGRVTLRLRGTRSNAYGVGAKVVVKSGGLRQVKELYPMRGYMSTDEPILHFGLGDRTRIDRIEIHWPSGACQIFEDLPANHRYVATEPAAGAGRRSAGGEATLFQRIDLALPEAAARKEAHFSDFKKQPLLPFRESRLGGDIVLADFDGDGRLDVAIGGAKGQETGLLLNQGDGELEYAFNMDFETDFGSEDWDLEVADWNADGRPDLFVASGGVESPIDDPFYEDRLYLNTGDGFFTRDFEIGLSRARRSTSTARTADFDGDGDLDLFLGARTLPGRYPLADASSLWENRAGRFVEVSDSVAPGLADVGRVSDAQWSDIDEDGDPDLIIAIEWGPVDVWRNDNGAFRRDSPSLSRKRNYGLWNRVVVKDVDGDGRKDIVAGNLGLNTRYEATPAVPLSLWYSIDGSGEVSLVETVLEDGKQAFLGEKWRLEEAFPRARLKEMSFEAYASASLEEVFPNAEATFRRLTVSELRSCVFWQREDGDFEKQALPSFAQSGRAMALLVEDFDADGDLDVALSLEVVSSGPWSEGFETGQIAFLANDGEKRLRALSPWTSGLVVDGSPRGLAWGDVSGDGEPELLVNMSEGLLRAFSVRR